MDRLQLLDLPPVWLGSLILAPERDSCDPETLPLTNLFGTCSKLQQLMLSQRVIRPMLDIKPEDIGQLARPLHVQALTMAEAAGTKLGLVLQDFGAATTALCSVLLTSAATIHHLQQGQKPPASLSLNCITAVTLRSSTTPLKCLLPDVLVRHCPNLKELRVQGCTVGKAGASQLTCANLQRLALSVGGVKKKWFKQQLLNLPSLTVLDLHDTGSLDDYEEGGVCWAVISRYSSQLRGLRCERIDVDELSALPWSPTTHLPVLAELELNMSLDGDEILQHLLQTAPNLKRLSLLSISGLTSSFTEVPCSWQKLTLRDMYLAELAKLPLSSCTRLECWSQLYLYHPCNKPTPEQMTAAAQAAGGLQFGGPVWWISADAGITLHLSDVPWSESRAMLTVIGQCITCDRVRLDWSDCVGNPGAAAEMPELLPHVETFVFSGHPKPRIAEVIRMVRDASRPFILSVSQRLKEQLQQAMQEAGHQLVTFECW